MIHDMINENDKALDLGVAARSLCDASVLVKLAGSGREQMSPPGKAQEDAMGNFCPKPSSFCPLK